MAAAAKTAQSRAKALAEKKLQSSGLTLDDAKRLHISYLSPSQTAKLHKTFNHLCSLRIDYLDHAGKPLSDWPKSSPFYRLRYLEEPPVGFSNLTDAKPLRYVQEPDTAPVAYFPQNFSGWVELVNDINQPLIITEGELKAAKACKEGFPTLGLGGVYNWRSNRLGLTWLPSLEPITWVKRCVYICFDSDYTTNPMVCAALRALGDELQRRGAFVYLVTLPQLPGLEKVGLDDFLVHAGPSATGMFHDLLVNAEPLGLTQVLWDFNEKYAYVRRPGFIIDQHDFTSKVTPGAFKDHLEAPTQYQERQLKADGTVSYKTVSAAAAWLKWPLRTEVAHITYEPGSDRFVNNERGQLLFNCWQGWRVEPIKGDVRLFLKLVDHIFSGVEREAKEWFLRWCAYPFQHPGVKMFSSVVIHGIKQGTGKSLIGYTLGEIYGKNFTEINQMDLHNHFNEWAENRQFALGDDVTGSNKRQDADFLKKMITQKSLRLNPKYIPSYEVPDRINYYFTSNHPDSFFLEDEDRRYFIHEVLCDPLDSSFYKEYERWIFKSTEGASAIFHYLLNLDLGDFDPSGPAYRTAAKERMIDNGRSELASWVRELLATPDQVLRVGDIVADRDLFTSKELLGFYDPLGRTSTTANGLGRELSRAGIRQACDGKPVRLADGSQGRYYIVRNRDHWQSATMRQVADHLDASEGKKASKKTKKY